MYYINTIRYNRLYDLRFKQQKAENNRKEERPRNERK